MKKSTPIILKQPDFDFMAGYNESVRQAQSDVARYAIKKLKAKYKSFEEIANATGLTVGQLKRMAA